MRALRRVLTAAVVVGVLTSASSSALAWSAVSTQAQARPGLLGVAAGSSDTGPYGAPLINGCQWATWVARCQNLTVYGNGSLFGNSGCGPPNGCTFGPEFQCTELAQRYAYYAWGEPARWDGYGGDSGSAYQMWEAAAALPIPLQQFVQGGGVRPQQGDLLIFAQGWLGSYWDANGHAAVVSAVGPGYLDIVQENGTPSGSDRFALNGTTVVANGYTPVIGWLHNPMMSSTAATKLSVALSAQQQIAFWKGSDGHLREAWTNAGGAWSGVMDWTASWNGVGLLTSAPSVVATADGRQTVFWRGVGGHLWQAVYDGGWTGPVDLSPSWNAGQMLFSAPAATVTPGGQQLVFWQAANGDLDETWSTGRMWSAPTDWSATWAGGASLDSSPAAVVTPAGTQVVFWRSLSGHLVSASYTSSWTLPSEVLPSFSVGATMASAPSAAARADGVELVAWQAADGRMWGAWYSGSWNGPSLWDGLGHMASAPSVARGAGGVVTASWQGTDGNLHEASWTNAWSGPVDWTSSWQGAGVLGSAPSVVATATQQLVFWRGTEGHLWESWFDGRWNGPVDWTSQWRNAVTLASSPSVAATPSGQQLVFWTGTNQHLWEAWYDGIWHGPVDWTAQWIGAGLVGSAPAAAVTPAGDQQLVFWRGADGNLWEAWFTNSWNGPVNVSSQIGSTHPLGSAPSLTFSADGSQQLVYWRDTYGHLTEAWYAAGWGGPADWSSGALFGGLLASAPAATVTTTNDQLVFWQGLNGHLWETWWNGVISGPIDWGSAGAMSVESAPSAVALNSRQQLVFWRGTNGHLMEMWWSGAWESLLDIGIIGPLR